MKKITSAVLIIAMTILLFAMPCSAAIDADFNVNVSFDYEAKIISFTGTVAKTYGNRSITYYLMHPGKVQDDIPNATENDPAVLHYGQTKAGSDSKFSDSFRYSGEEGVYTLFITSGKVIKAISIDTSKDISASDSFQLSQLYKLPESYEAITTKDTRESFFIHKNELPDEMPIVSSREVRGLYTIYVDVKNGDDATATGAINAPYKTIKAATKAHKPESGMVLCLREGNYPASDANVLTVSATEELPYIITSYEGETVNIVGGTNIDSDMFQKITDTDVISRLNPAASDKILVADLKAMGVTNYGTITSSNSPVLFVGDSQYTIARWPNVELTGMIDIDDVPGLTEMGLEDTNGGTATKSGGTGVIDCGIVTSSMGSPCGEYRQYSKRATELNQAAGKVVSTDKGAEFCVADIRPFSWVNTGNIWMYVSLHDEWTHDRTKVAEFNPETRSVRTTTSNSWGTQYKSVNKFYYYNVFEELDSPGEWFMDDTTGKLYIYPATDITKEKVLFAPSDATMWEIKNSKNVIVNGINFEHARGQALKVSGSNTRNVVIQNCKFENVGSGVSFEGRYSGVINSEFTNVAGTSINLGGGTEAEIVKLIPARQFAQNNKIYNSKSISTRGVGNIVSHNYLSNVIGSCIYFSASRETVVEYNEIVAGPRETLDSGAIYLNGNQQFNRGNHVRYNFIHETGMSIGTKAPQSIYFDDMASENYAYGNFIIDGRMLFHNGSENAVYNNVILNPATGYQPITNSPNYYNQSVSTSLTVSPRWRQGALEYGTFTSSLKPGNAFNNGDGTIAADYAARYPKLVDWATLMYSRIAEYQELKKTLVPARASTTSNLESPYDGMNLNAYLAASRENVYENNAFINMGVNENTLKYGAIKGDGVPGEGGKIGSKTYNPTIEKGHINMQTANNPIIAENPFKNGDYNDPAAYEAMGIEPIPFDKIGLTSEADYPANKKTEALTPAHSAEATVVADNVSLKWKAVSGAQMYKVQLATDADFTDIVEEKTSFEMAYQVTKVLENDQIYYWRVVTIPVAKNVTGTSLTSDTFMFKTLPATETGEFNKYGVTDYVLEDDDGNILSEIPENGEFKVSGYAYNLTGTDKGALVYVALYNAKGKLLSVDMCTVSATGKSGTTGTSVTSGSFSGKFTTEKFTEPDTELIKIFVWSSDGNMVPYSFVKTIK